MRASLKHAIRFCLLAAPLFFFPPFAWAQANGANPRITSPIDASRLTTLKGNTHPLARAQYDRGPAPASLPMQRMMLVLKHSPSQDVALSELLEQQQEKGSPDYRKWLTPAQFGQQFGPSDQDIQTIVDWLETQGFQIDRVASGRGVIEFSGTAGDVQQAFHTAIHSYQVNGAAHWANANDPDIPAALSPVVAGIASLNSFPRKPLHHLAGIFQKSKGTGKMIPVQPAYTFPYGSSTLYALGPYDFATIYNVLPLWNAGIDGTGETIAIVAQTDIDPQDISDFRTVFGLPAGNLQIIHNGPAPGILSDSGDETESDLDVEWAGGVAKNATIDFVVSESTEASAGVDLSAEYIVDNDLAPILSMSYGACEAYLGTAGNQFYDQLWQQAAAEGITALIASGDAGSALCDQGDKGATHGLAVNGLASTPYNVAVGGTDFNDVLDATTYWNSTNDPTTQESARGYIPETAWNDTCTNPELELLLGASSDAETNCNEASLTARYPFLLEVIGGSGGASSCTSSSGTVASCSGGYAKPAWQTGTGVPNDVERDLPDISLFAGDGFNGNFYLFCEADFQGGPCDLSSEYFGGAGGTSVSAQAFAGIMALVDQADGGRQGNANYVLYQLAAQTGSSCNSSGMPASSCIFYDTTSGTNAMPCVTDSPDCTTNTTGDKYGVLSGFGTTAGYDRATGLGSMNAANLVNDWTNVTFRPSTTTLKLNGGSSVSITHGTPVSVAVSVSPTSPEPTGVVSLIATPASDSVDVGTFTLSNGTASGSTSMLPGGTAYNVIAHYAGDGTYGASDSSPVTVTVNPEASQTFANLETFDINGNFISHSATSATYGDGYFLLRLDVGNSSAAYSPTTGISSSCSNQTSSCPTGTVSVTTNGSPLAGSPFTLNTEGYAEDQSIAPGTYAITANYSGDSSYGPSGGTANFVINKAATTASITAGPGPNVAYGTEAGVTGQVTTTSQGIAPTGTFSFSLDGSPLAVDMTYQGFPYQLSGSSPSYAHLNGTGQQAFLSLGSHTLTMQYSGDTNYSPSTSAAYTFTVEQALPSFEPLGSTNQASVNANQQTTLLATLDGTEFGVAPTGTVTFSDNGTALTGTVTYKSTGPSPSTGQDYSYLQASIPWTPTVAGNHTITVSYAGDTYYLPASSDPLTVDVLGPDFLLPSSLSPVTIASPGGSGTATITVTSQQGFTGIVDFSVTCPSSTYEIACGVNPSNVTLSSTNTTASTTLTVSTTAPSMLTPGERPSDFGWLGAAAVLTFFVCLAILLIKQPRPQRRWSTALGLLALCSVLAMASCGGGGSASPSNPGTPQGTYSVVVTGTSGSLSHSATLTVNVQ